MTTLIQTLSTLPTFALAAIAAVAGAVGAITAAIISSVVAKLVVTPFLSARDQMDRESEWRKHALELTKLDLERKIKTRRVGDTNQIRPSILDFLANYRDLQDLGKRKRSKKYRFWARSKLVTPGELYTTIKARRITPAAPAPTTTSPQSESRGASDDGSG
jgi:hypothetical protein